MFSNPIKRLTDSLNQAQEQARQQLAKSQRQDSNSKPLPVVDVEESSFVNDDTPSSNIPSEPRQSTEPERKDENTLPKEVRIKLAKLAKYEDRHPKLQAAYKESQGRIAGFEKVLRERTPLGSIDEVEDFGNYLNTLSVRTNMSLEELKRVTEAHEALKTELNNIRKTHRLEFASQEDVIKELRTKLEESQRRVPKATDGDTTEALEKLQSELKEKEEALEESQRAAAEVQKMINELKEQLEEGNLAKEGVVGLRSEIESLVTAKEELLRDSKLKEDTLQTEGQNKDRQIRQLQLKNQELVQQLLSLKSPQMQSAAPQDHEITNGYAPSEAPTLVPSEPPTSANKKKKKKKKKITGAVQAAEPVSSPTLEQQKEEGVDTYPRRLLEDYLTQLTKSLDSGSFEDLGAASSQLSDGTEIWQESISRGIQPAQLHEIKATAESLSKDKEIDTKIEALDSKLSGFATQITSLVKQLVKANAGQDVLKAKLSKTEIELQSAREQEKCLQEKHRKLEATIEDVEELRDMLRAVGNDLMDAKDKIKELETREMAVSAEKAELEANIARLSSELMESQQTSKSVEDMQSQITTAEALASTRLAELDEANKALSTVETELVHLKSELATVSADKNDLTSKSADLQTKLRQVERSEKEAREATTTLQNTIFSKEKEISKLRTDLSDLQNAKANLEETLRSTNVTLTNIESERTELIQREQFTLNNVAKLKRETELYRERNAALESRRTALTNERDSLVEEVQVKTARLESIQTTMHSLREQATEMGHRAREAKDRCEALEEELSEAHKLLSERSREAGTMRRLLDEAEGREQGRIKEAREKLEQAVEERDHLEEEITILRRNNAEGSGELTKSLREKETLVKELTEKYDVTRNEVGELRKRNHDIRMMLEQARKEADDATSKFTKLSKSLEEMTFQTQQLQEERTAIKEAAEQSQSRVEQLQRTQRHLSEELKRLKAAEKKTPPSPSPANSRVSLMEPRSPIAQTPRQSISSNGTDPTKAAIDKEYLRNVLIQFFEHKDKRAQLLPVLSMLLNFSKADEMKILR